MKCSRLDAFCNCDVHGAQRFCAFLKPKPEKSLTLSRAVKAAFGKCECQAHGWWWIERCGRSNGGAGPYSPSHAFSSCSVPGAPGILVFWIRTLRITLTLGEQWNQAFGGSAKHVGGCQIESFGRRETGWGSAVLPLALSFVVAVSLDL